MIGTRLSQLRAMLRAEVGQTMNTAVTSSDENMNQLFANKQQLLSSLYDFPHLLDRWDVTANSRFVYTPTTDIQGATAKMNLERPVKVEVLFNEIYSELERGIGAEEYNLFNSATPEAQDPIQRWQPANVFYVPAPDLADISVVGTGTGTLSGLFRYVFTYTTSQGDTPESAAVAITVSSVTSVDISMTVIDDAEVTKLNVYRTKSNLPGVYYLIASVTLSGTTATYSDTTADSSLSDAVTFSDDLIYASRFEVWPVPATAQTVRFTGQRVPRTLASDDTPCDLDDLLMVYSVASDVLALLGPEFAQMAASKRALAAERLNRCINASSSPTRPLVLGQNSLEPYGRKIVPIKIVTVA